MKERHHRSRAGMIKLTKKRGQILRGWGQKMGRSKGANKLGAEKFSDFKQKTLIRWRLPKGGMTWPRQAGKARFECAQGAMGKGEKICSRRGKAMGEHVSVWEGITAGDKENRGGGSLTLLKRGKIVECLKKIRLTPPQKRFVMEAGAQSFDSKGEKKHLDGNGRKECVSGSALS